MIFGKDRGNLIWQGNDGKTMAVKVYRYNNGTFQFTLMDGTVIEPLQERVEHDTKIRIEYG